MKFRFIPHNVIPLAVSVFFIFPTACSNKEHKTADPGNIEEFVTNIPEKAQEPKVPRPGDPDYRFKDGNEIISYLDTCDDSSRYDGGILSVIAREVPKYADRLLASQSERFLVVDKASMRVILYDRFGHIEKAYDMACAKNFGTKHKKADSRTPEGFFEVEGIYNSTEWLFTDDDGVTSKKKGQFGPRFIRLKIPTTSQIGIHGTCSPWSIGHRSSHGCIRITNDNILELVELVEPGMPVIVLPGKRDRAVNREEGYDIPYFPTAPKYAMTETEKAFKINKTDNKTESIKSDSTVISDSSPIFETDDIKENTETNDSVRNDKISVPDSI